MIYSKPLTEGATKTNVKKYNRVPKMTNPPPPPQPKTRIINQYGQPAHIHIKPPEQSVVIHERPDANTYFNEGGPEWMKYFLVFLLGLLLGAVIVYFSLKK